MDPISLVLLSIGLAMDAFAVAIAMGATMPSLRPTQAARLALAFGGAQGLMPVVGYLAGRTLADHAWVAAWDHWIAFGLLAFLGGKMIYEARFLPDDETAARPEGDPTKSATLVVLALATSIDALAVGASLALLGVRILMPSLVIGLTAGIFALIGAHLGRRFGPGLGKRVEVFGGVVLVAIGLRILVDHLMHPAPGEPGIGVVWGLFGD